MTLTPKFCTTKFKPGPGGIDCPCCTRGDKRYHKIAQRRSTRRALKQNRILPLEV